MIVPTTYPGSGISGLTWGQKSIKMPLPFILSFLSPLSTLSPPHSRLSRLSLDDIDTHPIRHSWVKRERQGENRSVTTDSRVSYDDEDEDECRVQSTNIILIHHITSLPCRANHSCSSLYVISYCHTLLNSTRQATEYRGQLQWTDYLRTVQSNCSPRL